MAFVNLPPNLQDMFYALSDRIMKLETSPNQAMYTAEYAQGLAITASDEALYSQSVATEAQIQAINAGIQANQAAAQATIAQSQATIASTQATQAQTSANGKNNNTYSTSAPGSTPNIAGDLWFQYGTSAPYINKVIAQFVGRGGTTWSSMPITGLVVTNIDAGSITTGTLSAIQITAGSGTQSFNVSSTGVMSAQGVYVKGAIVADSGTFTGTIQANQGYFGGSTNYWSIGTDGITGVGQATITAGKISGSTIDIGAGNFTVNSSGKLTATSGQIGGFYFGSTYFGSSASISGGYYWNPSSGLLNTGNIIIGIGAGSTGINMGGANIGMFGGTINMGSGGNIAFAGGNITSAGSIGGTTIAAGSGGITSSGNATIDGSVTFGITNQFQYLSSSGVLRSAFTWGNAVTTSTPRAMQINSVGNFGTTASTRRKKHEIENYAINSAALLELPVRCFKYLPELDPEQNIIHGFIAEEARDLGLDELIQYDSQGIPDYFAYEKLPIFLLQLVQELKAEIDQIKGAQ